MTAEFLVIVGYLGIGTERCWKRLFEGRWYSWKLNFVKSFKALFKANTWSFDLKSGVSWFGIDLGSSLVLDRQHVEWVPEHVVFRYRALRRNSSRSPYLPVSSRRFLSDY